VPPKVTPDRTGLLDRVGQGAAVVDHWAMGIPSTMAGLFNSAIPGQPMGDLWSAKSAAQDARSAVAQSGYADLLALPEAFAGAMPGAAPMAPAAARMAPPAARQAGRIAESAIDPIYQAMPSNAVGMFGGKLAKTADTAALARAEDMAAKGLPREQIWSDTGWFQGKDGKWRFEIDDSGAAARGADTSRNLGDALNHPDLYAAYPGMERVKFKPDYSGGGEYHDGNMFVRPRITASPYDTSTMLHEGQHRIQFLEDFPNGSSPEAEAVRARYGNGIAADARLYLDLIKSRGDIRIEGDEAASAMSAYRRNAGEVEARAVEQRMGLTADERRARPPWQDYDVPESDQIVRFGGNSPQMSMGDGSAGITAYHGSPHDFDRFDMSRIGTGEGAQAYGHGLYFAESEGVAKSYKNALGSQKMKDGTPFDERNPAHWAADAVERAGGDKAKAAQFLASEMTPDMKVHDGGQYQRLLRAKGMIERGESVPEIGAGRMYEVRIDADPSDFLDWDKPLSAQSEKVRGALDEMVASDPYYTKHGPWDEPSKPVSYYLPAGSGRAVTMSDHLKERGVNGIRYLDQGSRTAGEGSRNYVVFDAELISVIKKYGIVGAAGMYGWDRVNAALDGQESGPGL